MEGHVFSYASTTVTVVKEISQISVANKYSKVPDSGEARESKANHEFPDKIVFFFEGGGVGGKERVVFSIKALIGSILQY